MPLSVELDTHANYRRNRRKRQARNSTSWQSHPAERGTYLV